MLVRSLINPCHTSRSTLDNDSGLALAVTTRSAVRNTENNTIIIRGNIPDTQQVHDTKTAASAAHAPALLPAPRRNTTDATETSQQQQQTHSGDPALAQPGLSSAVEPNPYKKRSMLLVRFRGIDWKDDSVLNADNVISNFSGNYLGFSNHYPLPILIDGKEYLSVQDALETNQFFLDPSFLGNTEESSNDETDNFTKFVKQLRLNCNRTLKKNALLFLRNCLTAKFSENSECKRLLLSTKGKLLIYQNKICQNELGVCVCSYCKDTKPLNLLGVELMALRQNLVNQMINININIRTHFPFVVLKEIATRNDIHFEIYVLALKLLIKFNP
ncbi:N-glycosidase YbiA [Frankliniella fusca]|uniref:N-glycosidase YbiA n=1 Tax=Frankliniella fusca TaxID=407009 RepID=A0AAE1H3V4_9NEOP|nr:N-glycosidase YbiA [Frankliniella fusca]